MLNRYATALALGAMVVLASLPAVATDVVINNGLYPPTATNVLTDATYVNDHVFVRNVGCPPSGAAWADCPSPGAKTRVRIINGGEAFALLAYDTSDVIMDGGILTLGEFAAYGSGFARFSGGVAGSDLYTYDDATMEIRGGQVDGDVLSFFDSRIDVYGAVMNSDVIALGNSQLHLHGGIVAQGLYVADSAVLAIHGRNFNVDGIPISYGDLQANTGKTSGILTGTLSTAQGLANSFSISNTGSIDLVHACVDGDGDGYGVIGDIVCAGGANPDCDDSDPNTHPGATEICDGKDNDCNTLIDDGAIDIDADADGYALGLGCFIPGNDCNDNDPAIFPGNPEICDGKDNDCSAGIDNGLDTDGDSDGWALGQGCMLPGNDCDDGDPVRFPGNPEVCDGKDNDCDLAIDDGLDPDGDADGYAQGPGCFLPGNDCDDADPGRFPGNPEVCDGKDNDCDLAIDDGLDPDLDSDLYTSAPGCLLPGGDCNDLDGAMYPGNPEVCDGKDNNCNASIDEGFDPDLDGDGVSVAAGCLLPGNDCDDADPNNFPGNPEVCDGQDNDCSSVADDGLDDDLDADGYAAGTGCFGPGGDCNDADPAMFPGNPEVCDGKDNNCDGYADNGLDYDFDSDSFSPGVGCTLPGGDCNDFDGAMYPGNPEVCDGKDNDCNSATDEGLDLDLDGDGVSVAAGCLLPGNDCDDADPNNFPGNPEVCDGQDNDCDSVIDGAGVCMAAVPVTSALGFQLLALLLAAIGLAAARSRAFTG